MFLLLLCVSVHSQTSTTTPCHPLTYKGSVELNSLGCSIVFSYDSQCQKQPSIIYCQYISGCSVQENDVCLKYSILRETNANKCKLECCPVFSQKSQQLYTLFQCGLQASTNTTIIPQPEPNNNNSTSVTTNIDKQFYIFLALCGVLAIIIIVGICLRCRECCERGRRENISPHLYQEQPPSERRLSPIERAPLSSKFWERKPVNPYITKGQGESDSSLETCSICLNAGPNARLDCDHNFHKECITEWLARVLTCPLCKRKNLLSIQVTCKKCLVYSYTIKIGQLKASFSCEDVCNACRKYDSS